MKISIDRGDHSENGPRDRIAGEIVVATSRGKVEKTTDMAGISHPKMTNMTNLVADLIIKAVGTAITLEISETLNVDNPQTAAVSSAIDVEKKVI